MNENSKNGVNRSVINWFPGHMAKTIKEIKNKLSLIDIVIEIGDARAPISSFNHVLDEITKDKIKVMVFSKKDLADISKLSPILEDYSKKDIKCFVLNLKDKKDIKELVSYLESIKTNKGERYLKNGLIPPPNKALILGIPNVGKSTLINAILNKNRVSVANKPGHTKSMQLVKISSKLELIDSPGILQPNYENKEYLIRLSMIGSVKDEAVNLDIVYNYLSIYLLKEKIEEVRDRYKIEDNVTLDKDNLYLKIAKARHFVLNNNEIDAERAKYMVLNEFRSGLLGKVVVDV